MIDYPTWHRMQELHEAERLNPAQIARELGLAPRTVRTWLGQPYRPRKTSRRSSKLDPFTPEEFHETGFEACFNKPFKVDKLLEACVNAFDKLNHPPAGKAPADPVQDP